MKRNDLRCVFNVGAVAACLLAGLAAAQDDPSAKQPQREQLYVRLLGTSG